MVAEPKLGEPVDWRPSGRRPERVPLDGTSVILEPVDPGHHGDDLYRQSHDDDPTASVWAYLPYGPFEDRAAFMAWLAERQASEDPLFFAFRDKASGTTLGMGSFMRMVPDMGVIEIGHIWIVPAFQRTRSAGEALCLMMRHVFDDLGYRRLEWKCNALNERSRRAAQRLGFTYEGVFRQHLVVKGRNRDSAWYALLDGDWPKVRAAQDRWLAPENFDQDGKQILSLGQMNAAE